jgi:hypothetical protein
MSCDRAARPSVIDQKLSSRSAFNRCAEGKAYAKLRSVARMRTPLSS